MCVLWVCGGGEIGRTLVCVWGVRRDGGAHAPLPPFDGLSHHRGGHSHPPGTEGVPAALPPPGEPA